MPKPALLASFLLLAAPLLLLASCASPSPAPEAVALRLQYTFAAQPWLGNMQDCAGETLLSTELRAADFLDLQSADMVIRIGESAPLPHPAYQIGEEETLVIVNRQNHAAQWSADEVRRLFTGVVTNWREVNGPDAPVQVWVFAAGEDIQQVFEQTALGTAPVVSTARLAAGPAEMAKAVAEDVNAVGILPRRWMTDNVAGVFTVARVPVLVILPVEPKGAVASLLACLQK